MNGIGMPRRVRRECRRGWRLPEGATIVDRTSRWGNRFRPELRGGVWWVVDETGDGEPVIGNSYALALAEAVDLFELDLITWKTAPYSIEQVRSALAGRDLACWCAPDAPCHADILLYVANVPEWIEPDAATQGRLLAADLDALLPGGLIGGEDR